MADPNRIPEEAVERVALILEGSAPYRPTRRAREALRASGAVFFSDEEREALTEAVWYTDTGHNPEQDRALRSARQKLEESLGPDRIRNG